MKRLLFIVFTLFFSLTLLADEGMWMVNDINSALYKKMKSAGLKIKASDIYSPEQLSIKDAIVSLDYGGCSGSIVSKEGLLITNHHCAYSDVHSLSTPDRNLLEDGFWAFTRDEEIPVKDKVISFLRRVIDVTAEVETIMDSLDRIGQKNGKILNKVEKIMVKKMPHLDLRWQLVSLWRGNKFMLYLYEDYEDIRLVAAPPASIGAYGGEVDNWGWPQHKGDFAMYRVYAAKDGSPAKYSKDNIPLECNKWLKISTEGVKLGDYTMVLGYPYRTTRYISAPQLQNIVEVENAISSKVRRLKLDIMNKHMQQSSNTRLIYSDRYFNISNYCDNAKWCNKCVKRFDIISIREQEDKELEAWINASEERLKEYGDAVANLKEAYGMVSEINLNKMIVRETMLNGTLYLIHANRLNNLVNQLKRRKENCLKRGCKQIENYCNSNFKEMFYGHDIATEREVMTNMLQYCMDNADKDYLTAELKGMLAKHNNNCKQLVDYIFDNSALTDSVRFRQFFDRDLTIEDINNDPMVQLQNSINVIELNFKERDMLLEKGYDLIALRGKYVSALYNMRKERGDAQYPDANSTMRITYGNVVDLAPSDGIFNSWKSTHRGIIEKYDKDNYEFNIKSKVIDLIKAKDFGRWADSNGDLMVNFLSNNDITGGNSGSAVLNSKGELIGLAFDGNRESIAGDYYFDNEYCRCVNVDIRFVLWVLDKYAGAQNLISEMGL